MKLKRFENLNESYKKEYPYTINKNGLLVRGLESFSDIFLTDEEYDKLKGLSEAINKKCENLDEIKKTEIERLKLAIQKAKNDSKK